MTHRDRAGGPRGTSATRAPPQGFARAAWPRRDRSRGFEAVKLGRCWAGLYDLNRYYPKHVTVKLGSKAARLPFMEAPESFEKALRAFLNKFIN